MEFWQKIITQIAEIAPVYLVGGTVRDSLLHKPSKDVDGIVSLPLDTLEKYLQEWGYHPLRIGAKHQTLTVFHEGERMDLNPFSGDLKEDALRRDFTINAIYQNGRTGEIVDPLGGRKDLEKRILRACGDPYERLGEDPLRILRMVRFACKYHLTIEEKTLMAAQEILPKLSAVARERISEELGTILILDNPKSALTLLKDIGYMDMYLPELANLQNCMARPGYNEDLWEHTLKVVENTPPEYLLRLAGLFHHLENYKEVLARFRFSMVLGKGGIGGEKDLIWLIKNMGQGPLTFSQELRERKAPQEFAAKIRRFIWELGWTGRAFYGARVKHLLVLWRADFYGYKKVDPEESKYLEELLTVLQEETVKIQHENESFQWELLEKFAFKQKIKGRDWGDFKDYLRRKMILEKIPALTQELIAQEYKLFRKKKY